MKLEHSALWIPGRDSLGSYPVHGPHTETDRVNPPLLEDGLEPPQEAHSAPIAVAATAVNIEAAYINYVNKEHGAEDALMQVVGRLATNITRDKLSDSPRVSETLEDVAQMALIKVLDRLPTFNGVPGQFYSAVRTICQRTATDGFNKGLG